MHLTPFGRIGHLLLPAVLALAARDDPLVSSLAGSTVLFLHFQTITELTGTLSHFQPSVSKR